MRRCGHPTPIEAQASRSDARGSSHPRGLETHWGPHTGLLMTSDFAGARPLSPGSGEGRRSWDYVVTKRASVPSTAGAAEPVAPDRRLVPLEAYAYRAISASSVSTWLELGVWLTRSLRRYAARNFSIEKTVPRDSM